MKPMTLREACDAVKGSLVTNDGNASFDSVEMDSRIIKEGAMFVAIKGERVDGHDFIKKAFESGAVVALCDHVPENIEGSFIVVDNTVSALQKLAEHYRLSLNVKVVGITGSVGKTSTKEIIYSVLSEKYKAIKTLGNYNNEIGLPLTVFRIEADTEIAVLEMGISDFGEMRVLSRVAHPDVCVITNIGQCHMETLGSRDGILKAKTEIFEFMKPDGNVYLYGEDDKLVTIKEVNKKAPVFYGFGNNMYAYATNITTHGLKGSSMTIVLGSREIVTDIDIPGKHMVANAVVAAAIGEQFGLSLDEIANGIRNASTINGRCRLIPNGNGYIVDDCYNASPSSVEAALDTLSYANGRKVAVLGDMLELGSDSLKMHASIGKYACRTGVDLLLTVGERSLAMYNAALESFNDGSRVKYFKDVDSLLNEIDSLVTKNDNVWIKASNGMNFKRIVEHFER